MKYHRVEAAAATYLNAAAAPRNAYVPGVIQGTSGWQTAKIPASWYLLKGSRFVRARDERSQRSHRHSALTMMPIILPNVAPMAIEGTKIPAGTFAP